MIVDSSVLVAILKDEPEAASFTGILGSSNRNRLSAATFVETSIVIEMTRVLVLRTRLDELMNRANIEIEPVTERQARIARQAYRDYGKGSGHPARLNFGDCFGYALAKDLAEPLLFKGDDFSQTDLSPFLIARPTRSNGEAPSPPG